MATTAPPEIFKAYDVRGLYGEQIDGDVAEAVGRGFALVLADLAGKPASELRIGLGRDMRLTAPELAARYRDGMVAEGATVVDAGQVGSEMLYFLVGSRDLDGGLMCTASHNPKAYTGAKLVKQGAIALSGDAGIQDVRRRIEDGLGDPPGGGSVEDVEIYEEFQAAALKFIDPANVKPLRVVVDGGNGMAGPMVGPLLQQLGLDLVTAYWTPDGEFPDHEPNPLLPENREFIMRKVVEEQRRPRHRLGRRRRPLLLHRRPGRVRRRRLPHRAARRVAAAQVARRGDPLRRPREPRRRRHRARGRRHGAPQPRRPRVLQDAHARRGRDVRRRGLRPLLLPRLLLRRQRHDPGAAHPRAAERRGRDALRAARATTARRTSSPARSTRPSTTRTRRSPRSRSGTPTRGSATSTASPSTTTTGTSTCAPRTPSRCCGCAWSRSCRRRTWSPPRRDPGDHPLVSEGDTGSDAATRSRGPPTPASTAWRSRRRFRSARSTRTSSRTTR